MEEYQRTCDIMKAFLPTANAFSTTNTQPKHTTTTLLVCDLGLPKSRTL